MALWTLIAIPAGVTLLWLTLAALAIVATYRQWRRQSAQQQMDTETPRDQANRRP